MEKISVVIPVYNGEQYVVETIHSIINQTYPVYEIIIIDGNSTDATCDVIDALQKKDIINIVKQIGKGPAQARAQGIRSCSECADYIAFCDADDLWVPNKIEKQMKVFKNNNVGLVYSGMRLFGGVEKDFFINSHPTIKKLLFRNFIPNSSVVISSAVIKKVGVPNEHLEPFSFDEDYEYWLRIAEHFLLYGINELLILYRVHHNQISKKTPHSYKRLMNTYLHIITNSYHKKYRLLCYVKYLENFIKYYIYSLLTTWNQRKK